MPIHSGFNMDVRDVTMKDMVSVVSPSVTGTGDNVPGNFRKLTS